MFTVSKESVAELRQATGVGILAVRQSLVEAEGDMGKALEILRIRGAVTAEAISTRPATQGRVSAVIDGNVAVIVELNCETDFAAGNDTFKKLVSTSINAIKGSSSSTVSDILSENGSLKEEFNSVIGAIRENIHLTRFNRYVASENSYLCAYEHNGGKFAAILELSCADPKIFKNENFQALARDLAMQVTAMSPKYLSRDDVPADVVANELRIELSKPDLAEKPDHLRETIASGRVDKILSGSVLLMQPFVKDTTRTVAKVLEELSDLAGSSVNIVGFSRFALGEAPVVPAATTEDLSLNKNNLPKVF